MKTRRAEGGAHSGQTCQRSDQFAGAAHAGRGHTLKPLGTHDRQVNGARHHQQPLIGADVRGRLATTDVLFARLQRKRKTRPAIQINRAADDTARHLSHEFLACRHETEIRAARRQWAPQRLSVTNDNIGAALPPLARSFEQCERCGVYHGNHQGAVRVGPIGERINVFEHTEKIGLLDDQCGEILPGRRRQGSQVGLAGSANIGLLIEL